MTKIDDRTLDIVARTLWGEARGEIRHGLVAVAHVIRNRAAAPGWWGKDVESVCLKPYQFSCWNRGDPNYPYLAGLKAIPGREYVRCREVAVAVLEGLEPDPTRGATHYHAKSMRVPPKWTHGATLTTVIGGHRFFKDVP